MSIWVLHYSSHFTPVKCSFCIGDEKILNRMNFTSRKCSIAGRMLVNLHLLHQENHDYFVQFVLKKNSIMCGWLVNFLGLPIVVTDKQNKVGYLSLLEGKIHPLATFPRLKWILWNDAWKISMKTVEKKAQNSASSFSNVIISGISSFFLSWIWSWRKGKDEADAATTQN